MLLVDVHVLHHLQRSHQLQFQQILQVFQESSESGVGSALMHVKVVLVILHKHCVNRAGDRQYLVLSNKIRVFFEQDAQVLEMLILADVIFAQMTIEHSLRPQETHMPQLIQSHYQLVQQHRLRLSPQCQVSHAPAAHHDLPSLRTIYQSLKGSLDLIQTV